MDGCSGIDTAIQAAVSQMIGDYGILVGIVESEKGIGDFDQVVDDAIRSLRMNYIFIVR